MSLTPPTEAQPNAILHEEEEQEQQKQEEEMQEQEEKQEEEMQEEETQEQEEKQEEEQEQDEKQEAEMQEEEKQEETQEEEEEKQEEEKEQDEKQEEEMQEEETQEEEEEQEAEEQEAEGEAHRSVGHKSLLQTDDLFQYILHTSVYPREPEPARELREMTAKQPWSIMTISADEGQFLNLLLKLMNAKNTLEVGVYTGYSLLNTALALPHDGKIIAMDIDRQNYELGVPFLKKAGVYHKIDFREGAALPQLDEMLMDEKVHGFFDFIFVDADKDNYLNYHQRVIELVKVGGVIGYDNTLWNGAVAASQNKPFAHYIKHYLPFVMELNKALASDPRIEISQIPIGDGLTLCRRIV